MQGLLILADGGIIDRSVADFASSLWFFAILLIPLSLVQAWMVGVVGSGIGVADGFSPSLTRRFFISHALTVSAFFGWWIIDQLEGLPKAWIQSLATYQKWGLLLATVVLAPVCLQLSLCVLQRRFANGRRLL